MSADVDVLIIGAGASGAAFAWSMADTRMRILCLEQGDWMNPAEYPSTRRDWEVRMEREFSANPNVRRLAEIYDSLVLKALDEKIEERKRKEEKNITS